MTNIAMDNGPFIDDLPIKMAIFHSYVNVYQRVNLWGFRRKNYPLSQSNG